jgi:hypothetical protein
MNEFEAIAIEAGNYNDGKISVAEFRNFLAKFAAEAPEDEIDILAGALVGTLMDIERDR